MIGDSTMTNKPQQVFPETGWGMPLGARKVAQLAVNQVVAQKLPILSEHLAKPNEKNAVPPTTNGKDAQPNPLGNGCPTILLI